MNEPGAWALIILAGAYVLVLAGFMGVPGGALFLLIVGYLVYAYWTDS